jgi:hypothetical protein
MDEFARKSGAIFENHCICESTFRRLLQEKKLVVVERDGKVVIENRDIIIRASCRFTTCENCDKYSTQLKNSSTEEVANMAKNAKLIHNMEQQKQREWFQYQCSVANDYPYLKWTIMVDGMDQQKCTVPHFRQVCAID